MKQVVGISFLADNYWSPFTSVDVDVVLARAELFNVTGREVAGKPTTAVDAKGNPWIYNLGTLYPNNKLLGMCSWMLSSNDLLYILDRDISSSKSNETHKQASRIRKELIVKTLRNDFKDNPEIIKQFIDYTK